jgi:uncharacterized protein YkvS
LGEKGERLMKKAEVGNIIEFRDGLQGIVEKVNENSVIVDLTYMDNYRDLELEQRTVVNHKNYKVIKVSVV